MRTRVSIKEVSDNSDAASAGRERCGPVSGMRGVISGNI